MVDSQWRAPPASRLRRRNLPMCQRCRQDKQKCLPQDRDWEGKREKCQRCAQLGHECGPSERIIKKRPTVEMNGKGQRLIRLHDDIRTLERTESTSKGKLLFVDSEFDSDASISAWGSPADETGPNSSSGMPPNAMELRKIVAKLGDQNALRDLLRRDLVHCDRVERWLGEPVPIKAAINAIVRAVQKDFQHEVREARTLASSDLGTSRELILSELLCVMYRFSHPPSAEEQPMVSMDQKLIQQTLHLLRKNRGIYSEADWICGGVLGTAAVGDDACPALGSYIKASEAIGCILRGLVLYDIEHCALLQSSAYPASHLAYFQGDQSAAFTLWSASPTGNTSVDMFGRTLPHLAVYKSDDQMLRRLLRHDKTVAAKIDHDYFGMTPLQISACLDNVSCFSLMWTSGANVLAQDAKGRSVLALAARSGSQRVVASILQAGRCPPSLVPELREAIEAGHEHIAGMIIAHCSEKMPSIDRSIELDAARIAAEKAGFKEIAKRLSNSKAQPPIHQTAITYSDNFSCDSCEILEPANSSKENVYRDIKGSGGPTLQDYEYFCPQAIPYLEFAGPDTIWVDPVWFRDDSNKTFALDSQTFQYSDWDRLSSMRSVSECELNIPP